MHMFGSHDSKNYYIAESVLLLQFPATLVWFLSPVKWFPDRQRTGHEWWKFKKMAAPELSLLPLKPGDQLWRHLADGLGTGSG